MPRVAPEGRNAIPPCAEDHNSLLGLEPPQTDSDPAARWVAHHRLRYFLAGNSKDRALPNGQRNVREFAYVQINPKDNLNFLVVDVDHSDALMSLMHPAVPPPTWIIHKPASGHAQAGWAIDPVYRGYGHVPGPILYAQAVLRSLTRLVGGDENFTHTFVQNPAAWNPVGEVYWSERTEQWGLKELHRHMESYVDPFHDEILDGPAVSAWQPNQTRSLASRRLRRARRQATGRNCELFRATRRWLWTRWEEQQLEPHEPDALGYARELNRALENPLRDKEVRELSASACRQVRRGNGRPAKYAASGRRNPFLVRMGRIGGRVLSEAKLEAARTNVEAARSTRTVMADLKALKARAMFLAGESKKAIAEAFQASVRTVSRWLSRAVELAVDTTEEGGQEAEAATPPVASRMSTPNQRDGEGPGEGMDELPLERPEAAVETAEQVPGHGLGQGQEPQPPAVASAGVLERLDRVTGTQCSDPFGPWSAREVGPAPSPCTPSGGGSG